VDLRPEAGVGGKGSATCENYLKLTDQALVKTKEQEAAETHQKYSSVDRKLVNTGGAVCTKTEDKSEDKLVEINEEILYRGCIQNMAQILLGFKDPEVTGHAYYAVLKTPTRLLPEFLQDKKILEET
jgi:hypothetical protein